MFTYLKTNQYIGLVNNIFQHEESDQKTITQLAYLLLIEIVRVFNSAKVNAAEVGYDLVKPTQYINRMLSVSNYPLLYYY